VAMPCCTWTRSTRSPVAPSVVEPPAGPGLVPRGTTWGGGGNAVDQAVRDVVEERLQFRPVGPVAMLANVRTWGWLFNPISMYFAPAPMARGRGNSSPRSRTRLARASLLCGRAAWASRFAKVMHVSPFLPMDVEYALSYTTPADRFS